MVSDDDNVYEVGSANQFTTVMMDWVFAALLIRSLHGFVICIESLLLKTTDLALGEYIVM